MNKKALIIYGPSGIGKSTVASFLAKEYDYKHCNIDEFKWIFSDKRSKERTEIGEYIGYIYTKELINREYNVIIEALPDQYIKKIKHLLKENNYTTIEISLKAPVSQCIKNDATRTSRAYGKKIISEVYNALCYKRGNIIDVTGLSTKQIYNIIKKKVFGRNGRKKNI